jgi:heme-degrading monooxygenase HmoA
VRRSRLPATAKAANTTLLMRTRTIGTESNDCTEFAILSLWTSMDAVRAMAGEDVEQVEPHPEEARFFVHPDPAVVHYEIAEMS